ncbi:hypothetical protein [Faecalibacter bovis]|uniref:DUF5671 domain-containing protein n=1 Tax=Faecalibacter bovis TaxID=2898187 RepID=A0ABX7XAR4_9FLAO|nr:hypothetical protein [Faecalibacter bovis]QTV04954.1 hypothetical protein J9309_09145 [Faecalibacter bovis]
MVKKSVLNKLSDQELKKYLQSNSRFTSDAVKLALEILKERDFTFSDEEITRINSLIETKIENEQKEILIDSNLVYTNHPEAKELFTKVFIISVSIFGSFIFGCYYLYRNCKILNKSNQKAILYLMIFGLTSLVIDVISFPILYENREAITKTLRRSDFYTKYFENYFYLYIFLILRFIYSLAFIDILWRKFIGNDLKYKEKTDLI